MGTGSSAFSREELTVYETCTCLTSAEILLLHSKFKQLCGVTKDADLKLDSGGVEGGTGGSPGVKAKRDDVMQQEEFVNNPFAKRLCEIFSEDQSGDLCFDEYVDLYNVLSPRASLDVKMQTAFRLYDLDNNNYLNQDDLRGMLRTIATPPARGKKENGCLFTDNELSEIVGRVMRDCALPPRPPRTPFSRTAPPPLAAL